MASTDNGTSVGDQESHPTEASFERLMDHIAALEEELAHYASKYGLTDRARELLAKPIAV